jgi:hypothetical protein
MVVKRVAVFILQLGGVGAGKMEGGRELGKRG